MSPAIESAMVKFSQNLSHTTSNIEQQKKITVSPEQYEERLEQINVITADAYLDIKDAEIIQYAMQNMNKEQTEQYLSKIFTAINEGRLEVEPGGIF